MNKKSVNDSNDAAFGAFMKRLTDRPGGEGQAAVPGAIAVEKWSSKSIVEVTEELLRQLGK
jgi:hypothetical protein